MQFAHSDQTQVREVRLPIRVPGSQFLQPWQMRPEFERQPNQALLDEFQNQCAAAQVKRSLRQHRIACQQWFRNPRGDFERPRMMLIVAVPEGYEKAGVRDSLHRLANPFRVERFDGPETVPANCMNGRFRVRRALSNSSRTILPRGTPDVSAAARSHSASSSGSRTVIVLPICWKCNTQRCRLGCWGFGSRGLVPLM